MSSHSEHSSSSMDHCHDENDGGSAVTAATGTTGTNTSSSRPTIIRTSPSMNAVMDRVYNHPPPAASSSPRQSSSHTTTTAAAAGAGLIDMVVDMIRGALLYAPETPPQHAEQQQQQQHVLTYRDLSSRDTAAFMNWVSASTTVTAENSSNDDSMSLPSSSPRRRDHNNNNKRARRRKIHPQTDPFTMREGMTLSWQNVNLQVKTMGFGGTGTTRTILDHVWGIVPHQCTTAIMGPSGAGKTSLLNVLAGRMRTSSAATATTTGRSIQVHASAVRLNNYEVNPSKMSIRQMIAFVAQDDSLPPTETPREAIRFSAKLRLGRDMTDEQLDDLTEYMLNELGLINCADTIVGGPLLKGISGGERKRTSVGVELVVKPAMVFLDEPTSGLDAFSAVQVCRLLKKVAHAGASVLFTIHQPSSKIFREFDHLILLNKGRVMYQGPVEDVGEYFGARGHACPMNYNPADWIMKVAQKVPIEELEKDGFFPRDERELGEPTIPGDGEDELGRPRKTQNPINDRPPGFLTQVSMLVWRDMKYIRRDRTVTMARVIQATLLATLIGMIFFNVGQSSTASLANLHSQFGGIVLVSVIVMMGPAQAALMAFPDERPVFLREYTTNHYSVAAYFLSRLVMECILGAVQCLVIVSVAFYMISFDGSFWIFFGTCFALAMSSTAVAVAFGALAASNAPIATTLLPFVLLPQMLFIGFLITPDLIPVWLRWINYLCPMTYATRILVLDEFHHCSENPFEKLACDLLLWSINAEANEVWWYWLILVGQFFFFRIVALAILHRSAKKFY